MNTKDLLTITTVALGTAALTVTAFLGNTLDAEGDSHALTATLAKSELVANDIKLTFTAAEGRTFKAGDEPAFVLTAINTRDVSSTATIDVAMTATAPSSPFSRMIPVPSMLWQNQCTLTLAPHETRPRVHMPQEAMHVNDIVLKERRR